MDLTSLFGELPGPAGPQVPSRWALILNVLPPGQIRRSALPQQRLDSSDKPLGTVFALSRTQWV
jgi:hypothetical protein